MNKNVSLFCRISVSLLALVMLFTFVGCQETPADPAQTDPAQTDPVDTDPTESNPTESDPAETDPPEEGPNLPEVSYGNSIFTILIRGQMHDIYVEKVTAASSSMERAVYDRMKNVSLDYDVVFEVKNVGKVTATVASNVKSGTDVFDLVADHGTYVLDCVSAGHMYNWSNLKYVDLEAPWWNQASREAFTTPGGKTYAMHGDISHNLLENAICLFFNRDMIEDLELISPFELVRDNKWTFDKFEEYVVTLYSNMDGDGSGSFDTDSFGYGADLWCGPHAVLFSTGNPTVVWEDDEWRFSLTNDRVGNAMFDYRDLLFSSGAAYYVPGVRPNLGTAFLDGRMAFIDGVLGNASGFAGTGVNFGLLPFPKYDRRGTYGTYGSIGANVYAVMRNTSDENAERISVITEALAYGGYKNVLPLYYETVLAYQQLEDEDSLEMLKIIHDTIHIDFGYFYSKAGFTFQTTVTNPNGGSLSQAFGEVEESAIKHLMDTWNVLDLEEEAE